VQREADLRLRYKYGVTLQQKEQLLIAQSNRCAICSSKLTLRTAHLDHDHKKPWIIRGLLCGKCNRGLGMFDESTELLHLAVSYLKGSPRLTLETGTGDGAQPKGKSQ
jgi:hypothetical protein